MAITFDPPKRDAALRERGLDFLEAEVVLRGRRLDFDDERRDYGEVRRVTVGQLVGRMVIVVWTPRGDDCHVISMRKANAREIKRYAGLLR